MDGTICYLNTDLDLTSSDDLTVLAAAFEARGLIPMFVGRGEDSVWRARFMTEDQFTEPEQNIAPWSRQPSL